MDISALTTSIRRGECILVVGPELAPAPGTPPLATAFCNHAPTQHSPNTLIYSQNGLMTFANEDAEFEFAEAWVAFCETQAPGVLYRQLAGIPFPLVISLATDGRLEAAYEQVHGPAAKFFSVGLAKVSSTFADKPGPEQPVVASLLGNVRKSQHMVLTHSQMLDFLFNLMEGGREKALPEPIQEAMADAKRVLFVGCNLQAWYMQVMMRLLGLGAREGADRLRKPSAGKYQQLTPGEEAFFRTQFRMEFLEDEAPAVIAELALAFGEAPAPSNEHPVQTAVNASIARGELREALKALQEFFRENVQAMQDIILLRGRLSTLQEDIADGVISAEDASVQRNQIIRSIQTLAQDIPQP